jgi:hypothetical protein
LATGLSAGNTQISASAGGLGGSAALKVVGVAPVGVGGDLIVQNDIDIFDSTPGSVAWMQNLVTFTGTGPRAAGTKAWLECGRAPIFGTDWCHRAPPLEAQFSAKGITPERHASTAGTMTSIPSDVKIIIFFMPTASFTNAELTALFTFVAQGGRILYIGEHSGFTATHPPEIQLLRTFGSNMTIVPDCLFGTATIGPSHQLNAGMTDFPVNCASWLQNLGTNDKVIVSQSGRPTMVAVTASGPTPILVTRPVSAFDLKLDAKLQEFIAQQTLIARKRLLNGERATDRPTGSSIER